MPVFIVFFSLQVFRKKKKVLYFSHFPLHAKSLINLKFFHFIILTILLEK